MSGGDSVDRAGDERYELGMTMRKRVLGEAHVARSLASASEFTRPIQEFVTRACWGDIWGRPGLDLRTRSLLNLAILTALGRNHELGVHVKGAVNNGCSAQEIQETLLQTAIYCGVPAALESFRVAERALDEIATESGPDSGDGAPR